jgi:hypothetical protein
VAGILASGGAVSADRAAVLAHLSDGSIGRALALNQKDLADWTLDAIAQVAAVPGGTAVFALDLAEQLGKGRERAETTRRLLALFDVLGVFYRDAAAGAWAGGWAQVLGRQAALAAADVIAGFDLLDEARRALDLNCNPQITLESLFMKMRAARS